jgi:hypothetical protein
MPPPHPFIVQSGREAVGFMHTASWAVPHHAFCAAQFQAQFHGDRRRVVKDGAVWRIEITRRPRRDGWEVAG